MAEDERDRSLRIDGVSNDASSQLWQLFMVKNYFARKTIHTVRNKHESEVTGVVSYISIRLDLKLIGTSLLATKRPT